MKKAKIILSVIALLAVVGGAFAFKASKFGVGPRAYTTTNVTSSTVGTNVYTTTGTFCVTTSPIQYIRTVGSGGVIGTTYLTSAEFSTTTLISNNLTITRSFPVCATLLNTTITTVP